MACVPRCVEESLSVHAKGPAILLIALTSHLINRSDRAGGNKPGSDLNTPVMRFRPVSTGWQRDPYKRFI
eukprot:scaffold88130_cov15-Prasinocladus_malaysianus.AAC.2